MNLDAMALAVADFLMPNLHEERLECLLCQKNIGKINEPTIVSHGFVIINGMVVSIFFVIPLSLYMVWSNPAELLDDDLETTYLNANFEGISGLLS